ncbi:hypothetical protein [Aliamphritea spongicola]|nr:hypothetical protein [Aliamphritea spongicola]
MNKAIFVLLLLATLVIHSLPTDNPLSRTLNSITLYSPLPTALTETSIANLNCFSEIKRLITASEISHEIWYSGSNPELVSNSRSINNQGLLLTVLRPLPLKPGESACYFSTQT